MCAVPTLVTTPQSGLAMRAKGGDLAGVVHAHLQDRIFVFRLQPQQLQRQAEAVVQIALGLEHVELRAQRRGHGFLGGGLARRAGNRHQPPAPLAAHMRGQRLQRRQRVFGNQQRSGQRRVGQRGHQRARNHRRYGPALAAPRPQSHVRPAALRAPQKTALLRPPCASRWSSRSPPARRRSPRSPAPPAPRPR